MRVMILIKATLESEAGTLPGEQLLTEMGAYNEELFKAGVLLAGEGLKPSSEGRRVIFTGSKKTVIDGPFPETNQLLAGFWLWNVESMDQAVEWVKRMPNPTGVNAEVEIRPIFEADDFGEALTAELREQEKRLRDQIAPE